MTGVQTCALPIFAVVSGLLASGAGGGTTTLFGDALTLLGTLGWVAYTRGAARFAALDVLEYTALTVLASWPLLLLGALLATAFGLASLPSAEGLSASWHALLYVGLVSSAISVLAFNHGVRALGAFTATAFLNFVPVSALLMSAALGKPPSAAELVGTAMVVAALLIHTLASASGYVPLRRAIPARSNPNACGAAP